VPWFYPGLHVRGCKQEPGVAHGYIRDSLTHLAYLNAAVYYVRVLHKNRGLQPPGGPGGRL